MEVCDEPQRKLKVMRVVFTRISDVSIDHINYLYCILYTVCDGMQSRTKQDVKRKQIVSFYLVLLVF